MSALETTDILYVYFVIIRGTLWDMTNQLEIW